MSAQNPESKGQSVGGRDQHEKGNMVGDTGAAWMQQVHQFDRDVTWQRPLGIN